MNRDPATADLGSIILDLNRILLYIGGGCSSAGRAGHLLIERLVVRYSSAPVYMPNILGQDVPQIPTFYFYYISSISTLTLTTV